MTSYRVQVRRGAQVVNAGTGWLARSTTVVTALHVVGFPGSAEWWHAEDSDIEYWLRIDRDRSLALTPLVFDVDADLALLALDTADDSLAVSPLADAAERGASWHAEGFPQAVGSVVASRQRNGRSSKNRRRPPVAPAHA